MTKKTIEQAYEELRQIIDGGSESFTHDDAVQYLKDKLAQPEQEPVAWRNAAIRVGEDLCSVGPFGYYDMTAEQWLDWALSVVTVHAPPPQRKPLTDEQIDAIADEYIVDYRIPAGCAWNFARAIEAAAHGIKE